jgi:hypothetical protein
MHGQPLLTRSDHSNDSPEEHQKADRVAGRAASCDRTASRAALVGEPLGPTLGDTGRLTGGWWSA